MRIRLGYVAIIIVMILALASAPLISGYFFQESYLKLISVLNVDNPFQIRVTDYKRGWFDSDAKLELVFTPNPAIKIDPDEKAKISPILKNIIITQHITHGPFIKYPEDSRWHFTRALIHTTVHAPKEAEDFLLGANNKNGLMQIQTYVSYDNFYKNHFHIPAILVANEDKSKLSWSGATGTLDAKITNNFVTQLKSGFTLGDSTLQENKNIFTSLPIAFSIDVDCASPEALCTSNNKITLPGMKNNYPDANFKLTDFMMQSNEYVTNKINYNSELVILLNKFESPFLTLGPLNINVSIKNLNVDVLTQLKSFYIDAKNSILQGNDYKAEYLVFLAHVNSELPKIISQTTSISEDMQIKTSYGDISSKAKLYWPANTPLPKSSADFVNASLELNLRVASTFVNAWLAQIDKYDSKANNSSQPLTDVLTEKMIPDKNQPDTRNATGKSRMKLDSLVAKGLITHEKDDYTVSITYENSVLKVNGIVIPLDAHPRNGPDS